MDTKELVLEGKEAQDFETAFTRKLSEAEIKEIETAEALYKKHCKLQNPYLRKFTLDDLDFDLLQSSDDITKLDCTEEDKSDPLHVNEFIQDHAKIAHNSKLTAVYTTKLKENGKLIACFTVSVFLIKAKKLSEEEQVKGSPIRSYPAVLLGQMCVDKAYRGGDIGIHMCTFALGVASNVSKRVGCMCLVLHTNEQKMKYYQDKCGFTKAKEEPDDKSIWMYKRVS